MNRKIEFRGKRISNSKWVHGDLVIHPNHTGYEYYIHAYHSDTEYLVDEETVGQFIGMYDKYYNQIFEGDKVRCVYKGCIFEYIVVWDNSELDFKFTNGEENYGSNFIYPKTCDVVDYMFNIYDVKVIGNIHDKEGIK